MNIYFYKVPGISRADTPLFATRAIQQLYFNDALLYEYQSVYYPPLYDNTIKVAKTFWDTVSNANYLSLWYDNFKYYYFIDDVRYVNESLVEIDISMDVIQTFLHVFDIKEGTIERRTINRFVPHPSPTSNEVLINRDYIRENVSEGDFYLYNKVKKSTQSKWGVIKIVESQYVDGSNVHGCSHVTEINTKHGKLVSNFKYIVYPYDSDGKKFMWVNYDGQGHNVTGTLKDYVPHFLKNYAPYIVDHYILFESPFHDWIHYATENDEEIVYIDGSKINIDLFNAPSGVTLTGGSDRQFTGLPNTFCPVATRQTFAQGLPQMDTWIYVSKYTGTPNGVSYNVTNGTVGVPSSHLAPYNAVYEPALFDENYWYCTFGNASVQSEFPWHLLTQIPTYFTCTVWSNTDTGIINYNIVAYNVDIDRYNNTVQDTNIPRLDIVVDSYTEYNANNRNRWSVAGLSAGLTGLDAVASMLGSAAGLYGTALKSRDNRYTTMKPLDRPYKKGAEKKMSKALDKYTMSTYDAMTGAVSGIVSPVLNQFFADRNKEFAPDVPKQISDTNGKLQTDDLEYYYREYRVRDYNKCGRFYQKYGYRVDTYVYNISNGTFIANFVNVRYNFDFIKFYDVVVKLSYLDTQENRLAIAERLINGVRFWHVDRADDMCNYNYNNTELWLNV